MIPYFKKLCNIALLLLFAVYKTDISVAYNISNLYLFYSGFSVAITPNDKGFALNQINIEYENLPFYIILILTGLFNFLA